jgi:hypothetical protein
MMVVSGWVRGVDGEKRDFGKKVYNCSSIGGTNSRDLL